MTAQPAIQMASCGECRVLVPATPNDEIVLLCPLHAQAEGLLEQLIIAEVIISNVSLFPQFKGAWDKKTLPAIRAAIAAAKGGAG